MQVAYVTPYDARNVANWSGLGTFIGRALELQSLQVEYIGPINEKPMWWARPKGAWIRRVLGKTYLPQVEPSVVRRTAKAESAKMQNSTADVVLGLAANHLTQLKCSQPMVLWTDMPLVGLIDFYDYATDLCNLSRRQLLEVEQTAIDRCAAVVYTSEWAAELARRTYKVTAGKISVVPFGANLEVAPSRDEALNAMRSRPWDICKLLFMGVDWKRKGGDIAVATARLLNESGIPTRLQILGCEPPAEVAGLPFVERLGFVGKKTPEGRAKVAQLISRSHFLMLPTRAEAYGLVFAEASAHAVPSVTTNVGGVGGVVTNDVNGVRLPLDAPASAYRDWIHDLFLNRDRYQQLCISAHDEFAARLNWDYAGRAMAQILRKAVEGRPRTP